MIFKNFIGKRIVVTLGKLLVQVCLYRVSRGTDETEKVINGIGVSKTRDKILVCILH